MSASFSINLTFFTKLPNEKKKMEKMKFDDREKWEPRFAMSCMMDYLPSNETFHSYAITFLRLVDYSTEFFFSQRFVAIQRLNLLLL